MVNIVRQSELAAARGWFDRSFLPAAAGGAPSGLPVAFRLGDRTTPSLFSGWTAKRHEPRTCDGFTLETLVLADPSTGLECCCEVKVYRDFPAVDWVVYLRNAGAADTPPIADIQPIDVLFAADRSAPCRVHHARGGLTQNDDFEPLQTPLTFRQGGSPLTLSARTGKCSTLHLPFFNLELGGSGAIGAIGWSGGWSATFDRVKEGVRVRAGMERTNLVLRPGEEIRTPRILLVFWEGSAGATAGSDRVRSHNVLRRLILAHYTPRPNGKLLEPPFCEGAWGAQPEASHLAKIGWLAKNRIPTECYWIDAGWYGERPISEAADGGGSGWMTQVGSWTPNKEAYPRGFRPIGEAAAKAGLGFVLWVEPERAHEGSDMTRTHPEWLLGPVPSGSVEGKNYMVNLGIPEARRHVTDLVSGLVREGRVTCYRQDFNDLKVPPLFAMGDAPDRIGMTEIRYITGLYAFWDELLSRHPGLIIDNCAGGGQRIDLETIARSVPLWRSDYQCFPFDPMAMQTQTQGLAPWVPLSAGVGNAATAYAVRSAAGPGMVTHWSSRTLDGRETFDLEAVRGLMQEALALRGYFYGDFYPLLSFSLAADAWAAWQYDLPERGEGMVLAFRRHESPFARWEARLQGLDPEATYELRCWDDRSTRRLSGRALMTEGFPVAIAAAPGSALFTYRRV